VDATVHNHRPPDAEVPALDQADTPSHNNPNQYRTRVRQGRINWPDVVEHAATIVYSYDTSVTLRQLFYRLVSEQMLPNTTAAYKGLSSTTAEARRDGDFPDLIDRGRKIHCAQHWRRLVDAVDAMARQARLDRTIGQDVSLYLGVEKAGMVVQLESWFEEFGIPILALGGYSSQTYVDNVSADVYGHDRPAVLLYAGDFDPSGEDIDRDFIERTDCWDEVIRVALTATQVRDYGLPINPGKVTDTRAAGFISRHGSLMQVELDAIDPDELHRLFQDAVDGFWDTSAYEAIREQERVERATILDSGVSS
jgi:hypothetical protein